MTSPVEHTETSTEDTVTVAACCEACGKTHLMVAQIHALIDGLMNSPMAGAMFGGGAPVPMPGNPPFGIPIPPMNRKERRQR